MEEILNKIREEQKVRAKKHKDIMESHQYKQEITYFDNLLNDFSWTISIIDFAITRYYEFGKKSLIIFGLADLVQSVVSISLSVKEGALNPIRRELRYMLELAVKYLFVDFSTSQLNLEEKFQHLNENVARSSIEPIKKIEGLSDEFITDVNDVYSQLSTYVHPSKKQLDEYLRRLEKGTEIGFESFQELKSLNKVTFRTLDIILVLLFKGIGMSLTGDIFINVLDDNKKWKFHKGKYSLLLSKSFNYKLERKRKI